MKLNLTLAVVIAAEAYLDAVAQLDKDYPFPGVERQDAMSDRRLNLGLCNFACHYVTSTFAGLEVHDRNIGQVYDFIADAMDAMCTCRAREQEYQLNAGYVTTAYGPTTHLRFVRDFIDYVRDTYRV